MLDKSSNKEELNKLFTQEFPGYNGAFDQLLMHRNFFEILKEIESCKLALNQNPPEDELTESYRDLIIELKQEKRTFISRHIENIINT